MSASPRDALEAVREAARSLVPDRDPVREATLLDVELPMELLVEEPLLDEERP